MNEQEFKDLEINTSIVELLELQRTICLNQREFALRLASLLLKFTKGLDPGYVDTFQDKVKEMFKDLI